MLRLFVIAIAALTLAGCSFFHPYRPNVQQGNIISKTKVQQLHTGMGMRQVENIMGKPVLENTFDNNRLVYVYEMNPNRGKIVKKRVILTFRNYRLVKIEKSA